MNYEFYLPLCNETFRVTEIMVPAGVPIEMRALSPNNTGGYLPQDVLYKEYVVPTAGVPGPGPQRIVIGNDGNWYYTPDHYDTFIKFQP